MTPEWDENAPHTPPPLECPRGATRGRDKASLQIFIQTPSLQICNNGKHLLERQRADGSQLASRAGKNSRRQRLWDPGTGAVGLTGGLLPTTEDTVPLGCLLELCKATALP